MKIEEILANDRIQETNPYSFQILMTKLDNAHPQYLPHGFSFFIKVVTCFAVLLLIMNLYTVFSHQKQERETAYQKAVFDEFLSHNYYDVVTNQNQKAFSLK
jgi:hypothetical protein